VTLQRLQLAGIAAERRFGELFDHPVEGLLRLCSLAGLAVSAAELHQDAVDR
jgi:hypothetical protein